MSILPKREPKRYTNYWIMLKNGDLQIREREPKGREFVTEISHKIEDDFYGQDTNHVLTHSVTGERKEMICRCGFDRQVRKLNAIKSLLGRN